MRKKIIQFFSVTALISTMFLTGCKKECTCPKETCTEAGAWVGVYASLTESVVVADSAFINNGVAKLSNSPYSYYWTGTELNFPACRNISGDSIRFDARIKNPLDEGAIEELDVTLTITGEQDSAIVQYVGRAHKQSVTILGLWNGPSLTGQSELVQLFQDWTDVSLEVKDNVIATYKNSVLVKSYTMPAGKKLGRIKRIQVVFKGTGSVDWVKLWNNAGTLKLREEFSLTKKSSIEWF